MESRGHIRMGVAFYCWDVLTGPRLRQVALVARACGRVAAELGRAFGWGEPLRDPGVGGFGLTNAVFAVGGTFLEVVAPVRPDTTAGRYLERRGGDGGYRHPRRAHRQPSSAATVTTPSRSGPRPPRLISGRGRGSECPARQVGAPAASRRSQREPVEPCASTQSPSRTTAVGSTTGRMSSATIAKCPMWTVSSNRSSVARSLLALWDSRVIDVLLTTRVCRRDTLDQARRPDPSGSVRFGRFGTLSWTQRAGRR